MEGSKLYVGNLSYSITNEEIKEAFAPFGEVKQVNVIEGKGFGFVEMATPEDAEKAREALNGKEFKGRTMKVDEARPPKSRPRRDFHGGGGGGGGRGRY
ncbi:MAG: RNA-binding protein [bacterium]